jgi:hypothetical protein
MNATTTLLHLKPPIMLAAASVTTPWVCHDLLP